MLRFGTIGYPLWRRKMPPLVRPLLKTLMRPYMPVDSDTHPPQTARDMAHYLLRWGILPELSPQEITQAISASQATISTVNPHASLITHTGETVRLPAQWEPTERVLLRWGMLYPAMWTMFAQMVSAISPVATVEIVVNDALWAHGIWVFLRHYCAQYTQELNEANVRFLVIATDDVWIRDYGAISGITPHGKRVVIDTHYDPLPNYPQAQDNAFTRHYAAHYGLPYTSLDLHFEGGNLWTDGAGTLFISEQVFEANPTHTRKTLLEAFRGIVDVQKLIITPRLWLEETGHIDLMLKLVDAQTIFVTAPELTNAQALRHIRHLLEGETNAHGQAYQVITLPTPPLYFNWGVFPIRRHYTNALTVNGRVLVPTYGIASDDIALKLFSDHMPQHTVIPIDSRVGIHGGGAVHCMTRELF
jgi:agmatine deiminase